MGPSPIPTSRKSLILKLKLPPSRQMPGKTTKVPTSTAPARQSLTETTATAATTTNTATQPKESLLWAYLLRRENGQLTNRLNTIEEALDDTTTKATELQMTLKDVQSVVEKLEAERQEVSNGMVMLKKVIGEVVLGQTVGLVTALREDVIGLQSGIREVIGKVEELVSQTGESRRRRCVADGTGILLSPTEDTSSGGRGSSLVEEGNQRNTLVDVALDNVDDGTTESGETDDLDATVPSLQTDFAICAAHAVSPRAICSEVISPRQSNASVSIVPDSVPSGNPFSPPESAQKPAFQYSDSGVQVSGLANSLLSPSVEPSASEPGNLLRHMSWKGHNLVEYFELAGAVRSQLPRRQQEGVIVEAFWKGLADEKIKRSLEIFLVDAGWTWNNLEKFCKAGLFSHIISSTAHAANSSITLNKRPRMGTVNGEGRRKKRKRRSIPLVAAGQDSDDGMPY